MTAAARFKESDVARAMKGARRAGFSRVRVGIDLQGNIVVDASDEPTLAVEGRRNPLDRLLEGR